MNTKRLKKIWKESYKKRPYRAIVLAGLAVIATGLAWGAVSLSLKADTVGTVSFQAENGTKTGLTTVADASASGGSAIKFGTADVTPPAGELMGWQLTPTNVGLAPHGLSCASLPPYTGSDAPAAGTVITGKLISVPLRLINGDITITKSCIRPTSNGPYGLVTTSDTNVCPNACAPARGQITITDSEFDGSLMTNQAVAYSAAFTGVGILERNYIHDTGSGIAFLNTGNTYTASAVNNYVHKMRAYGDAATSGSHNETATIRDYNTTSNPSRQLNIRGNYFLIDSGNDSGALFIQAWAGFINNVTVENNYMLGNNYQLVLEYHNNGYGNNMRAINNRFSGTGYGPGYTTGGSGWAQWTDNYLYDATKPDAKGAVVTKR